MGFFGSLLGFQFHKGTIKTSALDLRGLFSAISIP